jgi:hypothetical protein
MIGGREGRQGGRWSLRAFNTNHVHSRLFSVLVFYYLLTAALLLKQV